MMNGSSNNSTSGLDVTSAAVIALVNVISSVIGIVGNLLVCFIFYKTADLRTLSNAYVVVLAIADFIINALAQPLLISLVIQESSQKYNKTLETLYLVVVNYSCGVSILVLCSITTERFLAVVKPILYRTYDPKQRFYILTSISLITPFIYTILRMGITKKETSYVGAVVLVFTGVYLLSCHLAILVRLRHQRNKLTLLAHEENTKRNQVERAATVTTAIIVGFFTVMWLPCIYFLIRQPLNNTSIGHMWASTPALSNSALNPIIYALRMKKFKNALRRILVMDFTHYFNLHHALPSRS